MFIHRFDCPKCGDEVLFRSYSSWSTQFQRWEVKETRDARYWCPSCGDLDKPIEVTRITEADWNMSDEILWDGTPEDKERYYRKMEEHYGSDEWYRSKVREQRDYILESIPLHEFVSSENSRERSGWAYQKYKQWYHNEWKKEQGDNPADCPQGFLMDRAYLRHLEKMEEEEKNGDHHLAEQEEKSMWD